MLTDAGLLCQRRQGMRRLYRIRDQAFSQLKSFLDSFWDESLAQLKSEAELEARRQRGR
jgi:DNA-binding transcriptional ArsR family regulator